MTDTKTCDNEQCGKVIEPTVDRGQFCWWPIDEKGEMTDYEKAVMKDFCSMECVKAWAASL